MIGLTCYYLIRNQFYLYIQLMYTSIKSRRKNLKLFLDEGIQGLFFEGN